MESQERNSVEHLFSVTNLESGYYRLEGDRSVEFVFRGHRGDTYRFRMTFKTPVHRAGFVHLTQENRDEPNNSDGAD